MPRRRRSRSASPPRSPTSARPRRSCRTARCTPRAVPGRPRGRSACRGPHRGPAETRRPRPETRGPDTTPRPPRSATPWPARSRPPRASARRLRAGRWTRPRGSRRAWRGMPVARAMADPVPAPRGPMRVETPRGPRPSRRGSRHRFRPATSRTGPGHELVNECDRDAVADEGREAQGLPRSRG